TLREPSRLTCLVSSWLPKMRKARWTTTSAPSTRASTEARSSTSPCRYSARLQPCCAGSNGRRAIPTIRPIPGERSSDRITDLPMSPVGPVTATVSRREVPRREALTPVALEVRCRVVVLSPDLPDVTEPVPFVLLARPLHDRVDELPRLPLVGPVVGLEPVGLAEPAHGVLPMAR